MFLFIYAVESMKIKIISLILFSLFLISSISGIVNADITDTDNDGLDDGWETHYFGNLNEGPNDDPDGDGYSNLQEFERNSDPTDSNSPGSDNNNENDDNNNDESTSDNPLGDIGLTFQSIMIYAFILIIIFIASMVTIAIASVGIFIRLGKIKKELNKLPPEQGPHEEANNSE